MDFSKYVNEMDYVSIPRKPNFLNPHIAEPEDYRKYADRLEKYEEEYRKAIDAEAVYHKHTAELGEQFKRDALEELGLTDNPKADLLYSKCWELGHSNGLESVYGWLEDLVELIE